MARRDEIVSWCDELLEAPSWPDYAPNGLQVPGAVEVQRVASGVSAHLELLERGMRAGAQLVLCHHGLIWDGQPRVSEQLAERLRVALDAGLSVAAYHLPLDAHREIGNNVQLCRMLGFELDPRPFATVRDRAIGAIGRSEEGVDAAALPRLIGERLGREPLVFAAGPDRIRTIGIVSGAGSFAIADAAALRLDALLTGEPAEHAMADAREGRLHFIAAGHYATETLGIQRLGELVAERFGVGHEFIDVPNPV